MADTTITFAALLNRQGRDIHSGAFAQFGTFTYAASLSASQVFLALPIPHGVTVLDGYALSTHNASFSMLVMAGWTEAKSLFMADATIDTGVIKRFDKGLPHEVTITDTNTSPRIKPLAITVKTAASGSIGGTLTVMALLQRS